MEGYNFYSEKLKSNKAMCYMFGRIPLPPGIPFIFTISTIIVASLIEIAFPTFFIVPILFITVCFEHYSIVQLKSYILDECMNLEDDFQMDLIKNGVGEFMEDSLIVDDNDREDIFEEVIYITFSDGKNTFSYKIQNYYLFLISIVIMFIVIYSLFKFLNSFLIFS